MLINLPNLIDDEKCYATVRQLRCSEGLSCTTVVQLVAGFLKSDPQY